MKIEASHRVLADDAWWESLTKVQKQGYIEEHPNSKYAKRPITDDPKTNKSNPKDQQQKKQPQQKLEKSVDDSKPVNDDDLSYEDFKARKRYEELDQHIENLYDEYNASRDKKEKIEIDKKLKRAWKESDALVKNYGEHIKPDFVQKSFKDTPIGRAVRKVSTFFKKLSSEDQVLIKKGGLKSKSKTRTKAANVVKNTKSRIADEVKNSDEWGDAKKVIKKVKSGSTLTKGGKKVLKKFGRILGIAAGAAILGAAAPGVLGILAVYALNNFDDFFRFAVKSNLTAALGDDLDDSLDDDAILHDLIDRLADIIENKDLDEEQVESIIRMAAKRESNEDRSY